MNKVSNGLRVLIANRGAIAVRIIRTLRSMGMESVAVYHEADRESLHVRAADLRISLGAGSVRDTYLNPQKLLAAARDVGASALHPGYGFLSENAEFVRLCESAGLLFLGPTADQIEAFGLKHRARALAEASGVPLLPGSELLQDIDDAVATAARLGYPVMLKSSAGGGGVGMALCRDPAALRAAYDSVMQVSENNFASSSLFLERFIECARHIEVQVFGDGCGEVIAIGERDCSLQRRNQKVVEEAPAPNLADELRNRLQETAVQLLAPLHYRSAGTVEFIVDSVSGEFFFLEVNTRLQVEHGVTEAVYGVDIVRWMLELAIGTLPPLRDTAASLRPVGHSVQARVYAEDPYKQFQPCSGLLSTVTLPQAESGRLRIDHWIEAGIEVSPLFDPMLAKIIAVGADRAAALATLAEALQATDIYGIETNVDYLRGLLSLPALREGCYLTSTLGNVACVSRAFEVLSGGTLTTVQEYAVPGRASYWGVGVPPSGPFDDFSFRLGNRLLGNAEGLPGLECTLDGPELYFRHPCRAVITGAELAATLDDMPVDNWRVFAIGAGQQLRLGPVVGAGTRSYLLLEGGIECPPYLDSRSTFTLGQFGGHVGRKLRTGDVLHLGASGTTAGGTLPELMPALRPTIKRAWDLHVIPGPQGTAEFFSEDYLATFYAAKWVVHYNSSRTGVRLIGPKPEWSRSDGGEAGMHPSNIHDNAYAIGTIDFTGDMPIILGPDGPSLGGFVCPATVISSDLWKIGQLAAGDELRFRPVTLASAVAALEVQNRIISMLAPVHSALAPALTLEPEIHRLTFNDTLVTVRRSGDAWLLVEFGEMVLDITQRFHAHRLMLSCKDRPLPGVLEMTPGIRSLQFHYDPLAVDADELLQRLLERLQQVAEEPAQPVASRIIHLPLSWDDPACSLAVEKYQQSVRADAPWYPSNLEFIRRINGLDSVDDVRRIVFEASYLVMGLGDVYLGAPVATPVDPRHRLVTTKYNPARTWTAENSVGIGGSYLCVYGLEGPGGYQFVGRTLQMWNRYRTTSDFRHPWLLKFFDQLRFFPVEHDELERIRADFLLGDYQLQVEETQFDLRDYERARQEHREDILAFEQRRDTAFSEELAAWKLQGQFHFEQKEAPPQKAEQTVPDTFRKVASPVAGSVWNVLVQEAQQVVAGERLMVLESMKMEIEVLAPVGGIVRHITGLAGASVQPGQSLVYLEQLQ